MISYIYILLWVFSCIILKQIRCDYPCNNFGLMSGQYQSPCTNSLTFSYNLKKIQDMGADVLSTSQKLTISGWWKPTGNPDLTNQWQTLIYLSTNTNGVTLPMNGESELNGDNTRRLLAFFFNNNGQNQLQANYNQATPVVVPNFSSLMGQWSFYAFSINFNTKIFKIAINPIDSATQLAYQGSFTANIPTNFGVFPNLGLYFDATPAYFPSCSPMYGVQVSANYDLDTTNPQFLLELRHSDLNLIAHYTLMAPNTISPQFVSDTQFNLPDMMLGQTRDPEPILDPAWVSIGTYEALTFNQGSVATIVTNQEYNEQTFSYWMTINGNPANFMNILMSDKQANLILTISYKSAGGGYIIIICINTSSCYSSPPITTINGGGAGHEAVINICQFPGASKIFIRIYINGIQQAVGYINAVWPANPPALYALNNPSINYSGSYSMRNFRIYQGSYFRQYLNDPGQFTFCMSNCILQSSKFLSDQKCIYCSSGYVLANGICWPSTDYCPKADANTVHTQPYQECTPCLNTFAQIQQQCDYSIDLNPLVISGSTRLLTVPIPSPDSMNDDSVQITFNPPLPIVPQIFLSMSTLDYDLGSTAQSFQLSYNSLSTNGFTIKMQRGLGSGKIYNSQPFYVASIDPEIEIGQFSFTSTAFPNLANVATSDQWVSTIINFNTRQKFVPQVTAGYTGILIPPATGHSFQIVTQSIDVDKFQLSVKAYKGIPIQRIDIYYIAMNPSIPVYNILKNFMLTDESQIYSNTKCPSSRTCVYTGPAGKVPPQTIYMPVINIFNQTASQNNIRRVLTYKGIDTTKSTFSFQYDTWCNTQTSQFGIQSFALVKPCVKFYCLCDPVPPGYFSLPTSYACWQCDFKCQYCTVTATNCSKCKGNRVLASGCTCPPGTYEDYQSTICPSCKLGCASCVTSANNCQGNCLGARIGPDCQCPPGTVDDGTNNCPSDTDKGCNPKCARCSILDPTKCSVCAPGRVQDPQNPSNCICPAGQVDINNTCQNCNPRCNGCTGVQPYQCVACNGANRINPPTCICKDGYYDDGVSLDCIPCSSFCSTCNGSTNQNCIVCKPNRTKNIFTNNCDCPVGTYDSGLAICPACSFQCATCTNANTCTTCSGDRTGPPSCSTCPPGKYSGTQTNCSNCGYKCSTCSGSALNCLTCLGQNRISNPPSCDCQPGFYDTGNADCQQCDTNCKTCSGQSTKCLTCYSNRVLDTNTNTCVCPPNFYEVTGQQQCLPCDSRCNTCNSSGCIQCAQNRVNQPSCTCPFGTFDNYPTQVQCPNCSPICSGCVNNANQCLACQGQRTNLPACDQCPSGMYATLIAPNYCAKCDSICAQCTNTSSNCTQCSGYRVKVPVSGTSNYTCKCQDGTYEDFTFTQCRGCYSSCATCQGGSRLDCLSCKPGFALSVASGAGSCDCPSNTFMTKDGQSCQACDQKCLTCKGPSSSDCIICKVASDCTYIPPVDPVTPDIDLCRAVGILTLPQCDCSDQQYYNYTLKKCIPCANNCKRCYGNSISECVQCLDGYITQGNQCVPTVVYQDSQYTLSWLIVTFFGLLCLLVFPLFYSHFIEKIQKQYENSKKKSQTQQNLDENSRLNNLNHNQSNQIISLQNIQ
ncbi:hypothetical protein ABPG74_004550 [Tetrahymena malaccensis]